MNALAENKTVLAHNDFFEILRNVEYKRLDTHKQVYLDFTGGNLYAKSQILEHQDLLINNILGNPHSTNPTSQLSTKLVEEARQKVIDYFNAEDYYCIFTQNASNALKIVGESYPFNEKSHFLLLADNHNSVNGIRQFCLSKGGKVTYAPIYYQDLRMDEKFVMEKLQESENFENKLFAFPAQSNVSGVKHDLSWIKKAQDLGWDVLLDAAAFVPTNQLDLKEVKPDFVCVSFYKIFGYPTGIGCLLVNKKKFKKLQKPWFAGGTVSLVSVNAIHHFLINNHERFEDGTLNYLDIPAVKIGLDYIENIGIQRINERVASLRKYLFENLESLQHDNGRKLIQIFGPKDHQNLGGTIILGFYNQEGVRYEFEQIEEMANQHNISLRSGCFCNPGIDEVNNCLTDSELATYYSSHEQGDYKDMIKFLGKMRGATRISVGIATTKNDIDKLMNFMRELLNK
ncbi:aminotransferase class V-fold PLP-dependent enzyme [Cloacibacterium sp. TD35]|uniref:aminotransferase class V-fold PLP-dependent enzyme n=1 Tax=Cloacibacterium sp. TD35 TaxID=2976818 RepID=UPI00237D6537|nr:aminotransferase class V-fold PLP-dependent enzyme [Cloacibacterium sp. TD35]WDT67331.1 aminotransferase class V-fold PLP-dependent enzyme [Cloacibacterium sp. TD35]